MTCSVFLLTSDILHKILRSLALDAHQKCFHNTVLWIPIFSAKQINLAAKLLVLTVRFHGTHFRQFESIL